MPRRHKSTTTFEPGDEPARCCAKSTRTGERCKKTRMPNKRVCRSHGGLGGGRLKHGRDATSPQNSLLAIYTRGLSGDGSRDSLLDPCKPLAAQEAVMRRLMEMHAAKDSPNFRNVLKTLAEGVLAAREPEDIAKAAGKLAAHAMNGAAEAESLLHLARVIETYARQQEGAFRIIAGGKDIPVPVFQLMLVMMIDCVVTCVEEDQARRFLQEFGRRLMATGLGPASASSPDNGWPDLGPALTVARSVPNGEHAG